MNRFVTCVAAAALAASTIIAPAAAAEKPGYRALEFTQYVDQGYRIPIPESDVPVRVDLSARYDSGTVGLSLVLSALVTRDVRTNAISWIATDSDGRTAAGNSIASGDGVVARLRAPNGGDYAVLRVSGKHLELVQKAEAKRTKGYYSVRLWY